MTLHPTDSTSALLWTKSSYSTADGPECVEVAWRKSSYSTPDGPACVEFAEAQDHVHVRDSKRTDLPYLTLTAASWSSFLTYAVES